MNHTVIPISRWLVVLIIIVLLLIGIMVGMDVGQSLIRKDCKELRLTVINGQTYACKPHVISPKRVM